MSDFDKRGTITTRLMSPSSIPMLLEFQVLGGMKGGSFSHTWLSWGFLEALIQGDSPYPCDKTV